MKFAFVILHYLIFEDTDKCIQSILDNVRYKNYKIIVVDNGSKNDSMQKLKDKYSNKNKVILLENDENLGFAKGNNVGFNYAKSFLKADFIILINNDTIIEQSNFLDLILDKYKNEKFNILGPDIISTKDMLHQNPQRSKAFEKNEIKSIIRKLTVHLALNIIGCEKSIFNFYKFIKNKLQGNIEVNNNNGYDSNFNWQKEQKNVQLHGACLIFDPYYIKKYNGLYSETFMYAEEDILYYIASKEKLKILYSPLMQIYHKEASSIDKLFIDSNSKRQFIYINLKKSMKLLLKMHKNDNVYRKNIIDKT